MAIIRFSWKSVVLLSALVGCAAPQREGGGPARHEMLSLLMPSRIEIVEPFTRVKSFHGGATPDGIELLLRAVNALDNPGLMIAGKVRVELFEYVPASGERRGPRVEQWEIDLTTEKQQRAYWNNMTQMYAFSLAFNPKDEPTSDSYLLAVTYLSPLDDRLTDEYVISRGTVRNGQIPRPRSGG